MRTTVSRPRRRYRRVVGVTIPVVAAVTTAWAVVPTTALAAPARPGPVPVSGNPTITHLPRGLANRPTTVVLEMAGNPVTVNDANSPAPLPDDEKQREKDQLKSQQQPTEQQVRNLGGTVLGDYQLAYNGIKVNIPASKVSALNSLSNVVAVHSVQPVERSNIHGVPLIGGPQVWGGVPGLRGEGIKIAVIDTGIDYTHADFGGPGTPAAFTAASAHSTEPADPTMFGPNAPKVKGGIDLVGDSYDANPNNPTYQPTPHPDPNPLDCAGHGTHVAGTAGGFGVLDNGTTYHGPYDANTVASNKWLVGPGVAPLADLYAIRVFGCNGSTSVVVDAIEWAVAHKMDVINMSLGSPFGLKDDPDAVASENAAKAGVIVVASAGNSGPAPYMVGGPSVGRGVLSVAASDPTQSFPGASLALSTGTTVLAQDSNAETLPTGPLPVVVLKTTTGAMSIGCDPQEYVNAGVAGKVVVVKRGICARISKAIWGQQAGAAAVVMVNTSDTFPPFEGPIIIDPVTGQLYHVTIPFLGVKSSSGPALVAADGGTVTLSPTAFANPDYLKVAGFSSGGPTSGDSSVAPDVTAPGVSIASAGIGTGTGQFTFTGTSMAAPHTSGTAALVRQAHPDWKKVAYWEAAIAETADPGLVNGYATRLAGSGLIQAPPAAKTQVVGLGSDRTSAVNFGFAELGQDFRQTQDVALRNFGNSPVTFSLSTTNDAGSPHSVVLSNPQITIGPHDEADVSLQLRVPAATAGTSAAFSDVSGLLTFTPVGASNSGVTLRMPYYLVPQTVSNIRTRLNTEALRRSGSATATVTNRNGATTGNADWYAWGLSNPRDRALGYSNMRAVGAQAFPGLVAFAVSTYQRWSNPAMNEFDVYVDVNGDGIDDYVVVGADLGGLTTGFVNGTMATAVFDLRTGKGTIHYLADAPFDSTTLVLPADVSQLCASGSPCLSASSPRLTYHAVSFSVDGTTDASRGVASFNAFSPAVSTGMFDTVAPGQSATETVTFNQTEFAKTPALGFMIVSHDNRADDEAQLISLTGD